MRIIANENISGTAIRLLRDRGRDVYRSLFPKRNLLVFAPSDEKTERKKGA